MLVPALMNIAHTTYTPPEQHSRFRNQILLRGPPKDIEMFKPEKAMKEDSSGGACAETLQHIKAWKGWGAAFIARRTRASRILVCASTSRLFVALILRCR
jgi:hypothetical protein